MIKKYKLRKDLTIESAGHILYRIEALEDIPCQNVKKGDIGGYVESYNNLDENAWVFDDAKVYGSAIVRGSAMVSGFAAVCDDAIVRGSAQIRDEAIVRGSAQIRDDAIVCVFAMVYGNAVVRGSAQVRGYANVYDSAVVCDDIIGEKSSVTYIATEIYPVTITPSKITIGCQTHAKEEWFNYSDREIEEMDGLKAIHFWRKWKPILQAICENGKDGNND